jgi:hypothetical protein
VDDDGELLAAGVRRADLRMRLQVAPSLRRGRRAEVEVGAVEEPVDRRHARRAARRHRRQVEHLHSAEQRAQLVRADAPWRCGDAAQVFAGGVVAAVEQLLQPGDVGVGLVHAVHCAVPPRGLHLPPSRVRPARPAVGDDAGPMLFAILTIAVFVGLVIAAVVGWRMILRGH